MVVGIRGHPIHLSKGDRFGRRTALGKNKVEKKGNKRIRFEEMKCECGVVRRVRRSCLRNGKSKSCGCLNKEIVGKLATKHGARNGRRRFYKIYHGITTRCNNPNVPEYKQYGERGIKCTWRDYKEFEKDMREGYKAHSEEYGEKDTFIDRINVDGNYCKENCRRVTWHENQTQNKRCMWEYRYGISKKEIASKTGIKESYLPSLLRKFNGDFEFFIKEIEKKYNITLNYKIK